MMKKLISTLFPMGNISIVPRSREKDLEVNGLPKGFVPVGGEIIEFGEETHGNMHRVHYLLRVGALLVFLTVCTPEFGDTLFALIRGVAQADSDAADDLQKYARGAIALVCAPKMSAKAD